MYIPSNSVTLGTYFTNFQLEGSILPNYEPIFGSMIYSPECGNDFCIGGRDVTGTKIPGGPGLPQGILSDSHVIFPRDQWVHFEWYTHIGASGEIAAWLNGVKVCDGTTDTSGLKQTAMYFSPMIYGSSGTIYVDDITLYNTNIHA